MSAIAAAAATALGRDRHVGRAERVEVAVHRPHADPEAARQLLGRDAGATPAEGLGDREETLGPAHSPNLTGR